MTLAAHEDSLSLLDCFRCFSGVLTVKCSSIRIIRRDVTHFFTSYFLSVNFVGPNLLGEVSQLMSRSVGV